MSREKYDRQGVDEPIEARTINRPLEAVERALSGTVSAPLASTDASGGPAYRIDLPPEKDARLISNLGAGSYSFQVVTPDTLGAWTDGIGDDSGGDDPAYEYNGNGALVAGTIVRIKRIGGEWRFQVDTC